MCFSAGASFATAIGTGAIGLFTLSRAQKAREIPLAAMPLVFAVQQSAEGLVWLELAAQPAPIAILLANIFVAMALVLWPSYAPFAAALVEEDPKRRFVQWALLAIAIPVSAYGMVGLSAHPYIVCVARHSLSYSNGIPYPDAALAAYIASTCLPFMLSSHPTLRWLGLIVVAGLIVSSTLYYSAFVSVWCFFAAAASIAVYVHFLTMRKSKPFQQTAEQR